MCIRNHANRQIDLKKNERVAQIVLYPSVAVRVKEGRVPFDTERGPTSGSTGTLPVTHCPPST